jgi:hypothetical protein
MFGHRLSHLKKLIRNLNHHLRHRSSVFGHFDSLFYQIFGEMSSMRSTLCAVATTAGGCDVRCSTDGLTISAMPADRYRILRALEDAGAEIVSFSTVEPSLEDIYLRYIHEDPSNLSVTAPRRLREPVAVAG